MVSEDAPIVERHHCFSVHPKIENSKRDCLDWAVAKDGPLVAYRWDGATELSNSKLLGEGVFMDDIRVGNLAVIVKGFEVNIGKMVYVSGFEPQHDFIQMGWGIKDGWRVRVWSPSPLLRTIGWGQTGVTPVGTLRRLDPLPPKMQHDLERAIAKLDFDDALKELAEYFERQKQIEEVAL